MSNKVNARQSQDAAKRRAPKKRSLIVRDMVLRGGSDREGMRDRRERRPKDARNDWTRFEDDAE